MQIRDTSKKLKKANTDLLIVTDEKRAKVIHYRMDLFMSFREISESLNIGYDNTRKICRIFTQENRSTRKKRITKRIKFDARIITTPNTIS